MTYIMAAACGLIVANIYYSQTLVGPIGDQLGMSRQSSGLIVTLTQLGYCTGLLLLVPLADLLENRRLVVTLTLGCAFALALQGLAVSASFFLLASYLVGLGSVAVQILVALSAHLAPEERRGRVVGKVMSGLMLGVLLARPVASALAQSTGWKSVFWVSAALMVATAWLLARLLPQRQPGKTLSYGGLIVSMAKLYATTPVLRQRGLYQAFMFGAFSLFWTAAPLYLAAAPMGLGQGSIALFSLAGVAGVVAAPMAGAWADKGRLVMVTACSMLTVSLWFLATNLAVPGSSVSLGLLLAAAIGIDFGVTANLVVSQREIFSLAHDLRGRLNGLFISTFFLGGAAGSALGAWAYAEGGWPLTAYLGASLPATALVLFVFQESTRSRRLLKKKPL
jgi:predicted MFS family arabinose efflux permease